MPSQPSTKLSHLKCCQYHRSGGELNRSCGGDTAKPPASDAIAAGSRVLALQMASELEALSMRLKDRAHWIRMDLQNDLRPSPEGHEFGPIIPEAPAIEHLWGKVQAGYDALRTVRLRE